MTTYTPSTLAKALRVSRNKIMAKIHSGEIAAVNMSDGLTPRYRITQQAVDEWLERRAVKPVSKRLPPRRITQRTTENFFA